jgi:maltose alpha-D-glucosyltransferase/alpha-amylase
MREVFQSMRDHTRQNLVLLRDQLKSLNVDTAPMAERVLQLEPQITSRFHLLAERRFSALRIRCHGDFHLGQALFTGNDFVLIDFEGEPALPLSERRLKHSPLRDVAGMVRSFDYAAWAGLTEHVKRGNLARESWLKFQPWLRLWQEAVSASYLRAYRKTTEKSNLLPRSDEEFFAMLPAYLLQKAIYEVGYELNNRPEWLRIPLLGILQLLELPTSL